MHFDDGFCRQKEKTNKVSRAKCIINVFLIDVQADFRAAFQTAADQRADLYREFDL